jgi:hypothetical protein
VLVVELPVHMWRRGVMSRDQRVAGEPSGGAGRIGGGRCPGSR